MESCRRTSGAASGATVRPLDRRPPVPLRAHLRRRNPWLRFQRLWTEPVPRDRPAVYLRENALDSTVSFSRGCDLCRPLLPADAGRERIRVRDALHVARPEPLSRVRRRNGGDGYAAVGPVSADVVAEQAVSSALGADRMPANESVLAGRYGGHHRDVRLSGIYG